jgi:hypothetical protein
LCLIGLELVCVVCGIHNLEKKVNTSLMKLHFSPLCWIGETFSYHDNG